MMKKKKKTEEIFHKKSFRPLLSREGYYFFWVNYLSAHFIRNFNVFSQKKILKSLFNKLLSQGVKKMLYHCCYCRKEVTEKDGTVNNVSSWHTKCIEEKFIRYPKVFSEHIIFYE